MKEIHSEININATPMDVWEVLIDFERYPSWNPFIQKISGHKALNSRLSILIHLPDGMKMTFKPKIIQYIENTELRWKGKLLINGLFHGEHYFLIRMNEDYTTHFIQGERFSGLLTDFFLHKTIARSKRGIRMMNKALAAHFQ